MNFYLPGQGGIEKMAEKADEKALHTEKISAAKENTFLSCLRRKSYKKRGKS